MIRFVAFLFASILILEISATPAPNSSNNKKNYDVASPRTVNEFNVSAFLNSYLGPTIVLIGGIVIFDIFASVFVLGEKSRRPPKRHHFKKKYRVKAAARRRRPSLPKRKAVHHRNRHFGHIGRIGEDVTEEYFPQNELALQSLDLVDTTFGLINVDSEVCRERAICEMERTASQNSITGFIAKSLSSYINGFDKYEGAIDRGLNGQNCEEIYAQCPYSLADKWKLFRRR